MTCWDTLLYPLDGGGRGACGSTCCSAQDLPAVGLCPVAAAHQLFQFSAPLGQKHGHACAAVVVQAHVQARVQAVLSFLTFVLSVCLSVVVARVAAGVCCPAALCCAVQTIAERQAAEAAEAAAEEERQQRMAERQVRMLPSSCFCFLTWFRFVVFDVHYETLNLVPQCID